MSEPSVLISRVSLPAPGSIRCPTWENAILVAQHQLATFRDILQLVIFDEDAVVEDVAAFLEMHAEPTLE